MNSENSLDDLLDEVSSRDPDKAAWFRWIRPNLGEVAVLAMVRQYLAAPSPARVGLTSADPRAGKGPMETLLDVEWDADPDEPTSMHEVITDIATEG